MSDQSISQLNEYTNIQNTDEFVVVDLSAGVNGTKKTLWSNMVSKLQSALNFLTPTGNGSGLTGITTSQVTDTSNKRYVTDSQLTVIGNTSGINAGDETQSSIITKIGYTPENSANKENTTLDTSSTKYPTNNLVKTYVDTKVGNAIHYQGSWNASGNTYPTTGGSGTAGAIMKGDMFVISVAGTLGGAAIQVGDEIIANVDTPGQTSSNWNTLNTNVSYVPEDVANKVTTMIGNTASNTLYLTAKAIYDWATGLFAKLTGATFTGDLQIGTGGLSPELKLGDSGGISGDFGDIKIKNYFNKDIRFLDKDNNIKFKLNTSNGDIVVGGTAYIDSGDLRVGGAGGGLRKSSFSFITKNAADNGGVIFVQHADADGTVVGNRKWSLYGYLKKTTDGSLYAYEPFIEASFPTTDGTSTFTKNLDLYANNINLSGNVGIGTVAPSQKLQVAGSVAINNNIELGHATDTTLSRVSAGVIAVEGDTVPTIGKANTWTATQTIRQIVNSPKEITVASNAASTDVLYRINDITNNAAGAVTITLPTSGAVDGMMCLVRFYDFSAVAQTITWVNTENDVTPFGTSRGSTTIPKIAGFIYNSVTSKWTCVASS